MENENQQPVGSCGCGRSPTGNCIGWHGYSEDEFRQALAEYEARLLDKNNEEK